MDLINAYIGRNNYAELELMQDGVTVEEGAVTRAVLRFGSFCLDTEEVEHADWIELNEDATKITLHLGLVTDLKPGRYNASLTLYDAASTKGIAWTTFVIRARSWPVCPVQEEA
jgi:hypothetical protein